MRGRRIGLVMAFTIAFLPRGASAQDTPKIGLSMGYPASIGVVWQVTDRVALRPEIGVTKSSSEFTGSSISVSSGGVTTIGSTSTTSDAWQVSAGLSALFYLSKHDALRTYLSPRWAYTQLSSSPSTTNGPATTVLSGTTGHANFVSGSFGAQYALGDRFSVFGEVGLGFSRMVNSPVAVSIANVSSRTSALSTRSGAGVVVYF